MKKNAEQNGAILSPQILGLLYSTVVEYFSSAESIIGSGTTILDLKTGVQYNSELNQEEFPEADSNLGFRVL